MAAFKMACLQYTPSKVEYQSQAYDRQELLQHRQTLLRRAYDALRSGPAPEQAKEMLDIAPGEAKEKPSLPGGKDALSKYANYAAPADSNRLPTLRRESLDDKY